MRFFKGFWPIFERIIGFFSIFELLIVGNKLYFNYITEFGGNRKKQVKEDYSAIGMDDPSTLRMMEKENLDAFKKLTKVSNITLLKKVIKTYCEIDMCNYSTILMMYNEQNKASKKELEW